MQITKDASLTEAFFGADLNLEIKKKARTLVVCGLLAPVTERFLQRVGVEALTSNWFGVLTRLTVSEATLPLDHLQRKMGKVL